ncbi:MAG TPA: hypothetical protein PKK52_11005, partial [Syntrophorhabdus sp.]|nr:hypothetical protein [Syntrophorhabdus sp.]
LVVSREGSGIRIILDSSENELSSDGLQEYGEPFHNGHVRVCDALTQKDDVQYCARKRRLKNGQTCSIEPNLSENSGSHFMVLNYYSE